MTPACRPLMSLARFAAGLTIATLAALAVTAGDDKQELPAAVTARQFWAVTELVLDNHIAPPSRQEMLLAAARSLALARPSRADLGRRVSQITAPEQLAELLGELWPRSAAAEAPSERELVGTLLSALIESVPGRPELIPLAAYKAVEQISHNRYVGTGIQIRWNVKEDLTEIINPFPGGPARKAGARPGDLIVEVDGASMAKVPLGKVVEALRGDEGTPVTMVVRQAGSAAKRTLKMIRGVVPFTLLVGYTRVGEEDWTYRVDPAAPIGYVRVSRITSSAVHELRQIERRLQADGCKALVLDLRFTAEGDVPQTALLADALLDGGSICQVVDRQGHVKEYKAAPDCLFRGWPLAVLVGEPARGPGADVLAAALQANGRAVLVGERVRGGGFVTSPFRLPDDLGVVRLPTGVVELPLPPGAEREAGIGVRPDHVVPMRAKEWQALMEWQFDQDRPGGVSKEKAPADAQLAKAVELLRAALK